MGLDLKDENMIVKYIDRACNIILELPPIEKDVYIRKLSEETGVKEQAIYDLISEKAKINVKKMEKKYTKYDFGQKLYLEPAYMNAERSLLKIMVKDINAYQYIIDLVCEDDLVLDSHKKIFGLIKNALKEGVKDFEKYIETKCNDIESSKEWIKLQQVYIENTDNYKELINDCIKKIKKFKLEESKKEIMEKIKDFEIKGLFKESLKLVKELEIVQKDIMQMNSHEGR